MKISRLFAIALVTSLGSALPASAQKIGTADVGNGNRYPFGESRGDRYQQVYAASNFSGLTSINQINFFFIQSVGTGNTLTSGSFSLYLSTTTTAVNGLSTNFASNLGANNALFGTYNLGGTFTGSTLSFIGNTFIYDPSQGNLLLDIQVTGASGGQIFLDAMNGSAGGKFSRMHNYVGGDPAFMQNWGLVTEFSGITTTAPEPGTYALCGAGLLAMMALRRRRRI